MTILRANTISGLGTDGPVFDGSLEFNSQNYVILPKGTTDNRVGLGSTAGALRYNTDSNKVELWDGNQWVEVQSSRPDLNGGARGVFIAGQTPITAIDYINIASTGNAVSFGTLTSGARDQSQSMATASSTRGLHMGGNAPGGNGNTIDYLTISSTGNTQDFGDLHTSNFRGAACASSTRALYAGGYLYPAPGAAINNIQYVTIASQGVNGQDFGDLTSARASSGSFSSPTRGVWGGGYGSAPTYTRVNIIDFATISTLGNAFDFGDLSYAGYSQGSCSNPVRGLFAGYQGTSPVTGSNTIEYVTIASIGNSTDFGDLTRSNARVTAASSPTRGVFAGGYTNTPATTNNNIIDYVTINTQGNAVDFGDLTSNRNSSGGLSNAHGGL